MTEKMLNQERAKREWEETISELREVEEKNYLENRSRAESLEKSRKSREILEELKRQMTLKAESKAREEKIDRKFGEYLKREHEKFLIEERQKEEELHAKGISTLESFQ